MVRQLVQGMALLAHRPPSPLGRQYLVLLQLVFFILLLFLMLSTSSSGGSSCICSTSPSEEQSIEHHHIQVTLTLPPPLAACPGSTRPSSPLQPKEILGELGDEGSPIERSIEIPCLLRRPGRRPPGAPRLLLLLLIPDVEDLWKQPLLLHGSNGGQLLQGSRNAAAANGKGATEGARVETGRRGPAEGTRRSLPLSWRCACSLTRNRLASARAPSRPLSLFAGSLARPASHSSTEGTQEYAYVPKKRTGTALCSPSLSGFQGCSRGRSWAGHLSEEGRGSSWT